MLTPQKKVLLYVIAHHPLQWLSIQWWHFKHIRKAAIAAGNEAERMKRTKDEIKEIVFEASEKEAVYRTQEMVRLFKQGKYPAYVKTVEKACAKYGIPAW